MTETQFMQKWGVWKCAICQRLARQYLKAHTYIHLTTSPVKTTGKMPALKSICVLFIVCLSSSASVQTYLGIINID